MPKSRSLHSLRCYYALPKILGDLLIFVSREIIVTSDPILRSFEMGVVMLMGMAPLECKESGPTLQIKT